MKLVAENNSQHDIIVGMGPLATVYHWLPVGRNTWQHTTQVAHIHSVKPETHNGSSSDLFKYLISSRVTWSVEKNGTESTERHNAAQCMLRKGELTLAF